MVFYGRGLISLEGLVGCCDGIYWLLYVCRCIANDLRLSFAWSKGFMCGVYTSYLNAHQQEQEASRKEGMNAEAGNNAHPTENTSLFGLLTR